MDEQTPFERLLTLDQLCRKQAAGLPLQEKTIQTWSGIGFRLGERLFVAPMGEVGEVLHEPRHTLLPGVKKWVKGVANVRGRLLPIMDLSGFLGAEQSALRKKRRVLIVEYQEVFAGITVDEVFGMQHFAVDGFSEEVPVVEASLKPFLHGVFEREQPWLVFSPHALAQHPEFLHVSH